MPIAERGKQLGNPVLLVAVEEGDDSALRSDAQIRAEPAHPARVLSGDDSCRGERLNQAR